MRFTILIALFLLVSCSNSLDEKQIPASSSFVMSDKLMGTVLQSSEKEGIGKNLTFFGLNTDKPNVLLSNGITYPLEKRFENERTLTLILASPSKSGGIDSFVIDKKTGKFARVEAGLTDDVYAISSLGACK